jgi:hypothetical protein
MDKSAIMSFCAPLRHLEPFGWTEKSIAAMTVLRHPVDRVWSMFRFQTKMCFNCKNLTDIYDWIDSGTTDGFDSLCLAQLQNHEVENLLTSPIDSFNSDEEMVAEAIENMKSHFTLVGLTNELGATSEMMGQVFPWLALELPGTSNVCRLPHDNGSPTNNRCIPGGPPGSRKPTQHWDLPSHPDEETRKAIEAHNQRDMKLYAAAVQYFELQKRVMGMGEEV